jgi:hypothetical protein
MNFFHLTVAGVPLQDLLWLADIDDLKMVITVEKM